MQVELVSPERILYSGEADIVIARTAGGGDIAFLRDHAPFIGALDIAPLRIKSVDGTWHTVAVHGGFVEVSNNRVTVLSDLAELADEIDVTRAQRKREALEARNMTEDDIEAEAALRRAHVRLRVAEGEAH